MGKKKHSTGHVSKGERRSSIRTRGFGVTEADKLIRKIEALAKGQDAVFTIANPNKTQTNKLFIKYKVDGKTYQKYVQGGAEMKGTKNPLYFIGE